MSENDEKLYIFLTKDFPQIVRKDTKAAVLTIPPKNFRLKAEKSSLNVRKLFRKEQLISNLAFSINIFLGTRGIQFYQPHRKCYDRRPKNLRSVS